jgi:hypothetical protein
VFQKGLKDFHLNTGESHYESYKTSVMKVFDEVRFAWISSPLFHEFMESAHNLLYYKTNWTDPNVFTEQDVCEYYRENLTEDGYISFCDREDDRVREADEGDQEGEGAGGGAVKDAQLLFSIDQKKDSEIIRSLMSPKFV